MTETTILTEQEIKIFNRAGWFWLAFSLLFAFGAIYAGAQYSAAQAVLAQKELAYEQQQENLRRLQSIAHPRPAAVPAQTMNIMDGI